MNRFATLNERITSTLTAFSMSITHAMDVSDLLVEAKKRCGHGAWEAWLRDHCSLTFRSARRYMEMAKNRKEIEAQLSAKTATMADLNAQKLLAPQAGDTASASKVEGDGPDASDKYDKTQDNLIKRLEALGADAAEAAAEATMSFHRTGFRSPT